LVAKLLSRVFSAGTSPVVATVVLMALALAISCVLAFCIYRWIEVPSMAFGKRISKRFMLSPRDLKVLESSAP
jgi:peptidoglycan/LPS O-acetylase OafA/YrhL